MKTDRENQKEKLWADVRRYCRRQALFAQGQRVIAGVSGGADSMALLLFLLENGPRLGLAVEAAHVNHRLRGAEADRDEAFVRAFCQSRGVPLTLFRLGEGAACLGADGLPLKDAPWAGEMDRAGRENGLAGRSEEEARRARYACFEALAGARQALVATAHTLNDQAETLLFRLARGCGARGAGGIPPRRGVYRRPFLAIGRADTEDICRQAGIAWREDATNRQQDYARNRLRSQALPALLAANGGALEAMGRFCGQMRELSGYLEARGEILLGEAALEGERWDARTLAEAPAPERQAALQLLARGRFEPEARHLEEMEKALWQGGAVQPGPGLRFVVENGRVFWEEQTGLEPAPPHPLREGEEELPGGYFLKVQVIKDENFKKNAPVHKKDLNYLADYDKILQAEPILRTRQPGDFFRPAGRGVSKTLKKWYNEWKIPRPQRPLLPLLASGSRVLWVFDRGFAQGFEPDEGTRRLLEIRTGQKVEEEKQCGWTTMC